MTKETFARGIQLINTVLIQNAQIKSTDTLNSYYLLLEDITDENYLAGVLALMKRWKNPQFVPGPGEIRESAEKEMFGGLTKEEMILVDMVYKRTGTSFSDKKMNDLLRNSDTYLLLN